MQISAAELAQLLDAEIEGSPKAFVNKLVKIEEADESSLCFIANPKYEQFAEHTKACIVIISKQFSAKKNPNTTYLKVNDPYSSFAILLDKFSSIQNQAKSGWEKPLFIDDSANVDKNTYIGAFTYIGKNVNIAKNVQIYPNSYIGDNCTIEEGSIIYSGVHIYNHTRIGKNTIIHSGVVIGSDGFGFAPQKDGSFKKVPQTGNVIIGNNVEIGANTVIDRATLGSTILKDGVKLDNLVQIAHNVEIGESTVVASQAGISGSTKLGKHVMVGGQAGFVGHITIADGTKINAQSGVSKSIDKKGSSLSGSPAENFRQHYKNIALTRQLESLFNRIDKLEQELRNK